MKKLFPILLAALGFSALAQPVVPPPATQSEVNAGVVRNKYIAPATLSQYPGLQGGATNGIPKLNGVGTNTTLLLPVLGSNVTFETLLVRITSSGQTNYSTRGAFTNTVNAVASDSYQLLSGTFDIASNLTITNALEFKPGAKLRPASGTTITLMTWPVADEGQHIVDLSAGGRVVIDSAAVGSFASVKWWGAMGTNDDTVALQAAVDGTPDYRTLHFPPGAYTTSGLVISNRAQLRLQGPAIAPGKLQTHPQPTAILHSLGTTQPLVKWWGDSCVIDSLGFDASSPFALTNLCNVLVDVDQAVTHDHITSNGRIENSTFRNRGTNSAWRGVRFSSTSADNVEKFAVLNSAFYGGGYDPTPNYTYNTNNGIGIEGGVSSNQKGMRIENCQFTSCATNIMIGNGSWVIEGGFGTAPLTAIWQKAGELTVSHFRNEGYGGQFVRSSGTLRMFNNEIANGGYYVTNYPTVSMEENLTLTSGGNRWDPDGSTNQLVYGVAAGYSPILVSLGGDIYPHSNIRRWGIHNFSQHQVKPFSSGIVGFDLGTPPWTRLDTNFAFPFRVMDYTPGATPTIQIDPLSMASVAFGSATAGGYSYRFHETNGAISVSITDDFFQRVLLETGGNNGDSYMKLRHGAGREAVMQFESTNGVAAVLQVGVGDSGSFLRALQGSLSISVGGNVQDIYGTDLTVTRGGTNTFNKPAFFNDGIRSTGSNIFLTPVYGVTATNDAQLVTLAQLTAATNGLGAGSSAGTFTSGDWILRTNAALTEFWISNQVTAATFRFASNGAFYADELDVLNFFPTNFYLAPWQLMVGANSALIISNGVTGYRASIWGTNDSSLIANGSGITNLNGSSIASGTVVAARIDSEMATDAEVEAAYVSASGAFGTDKRVLRSDGTGRGSQASAITVDDSGNITGVSDITVGGTLIADGATFAGQVDLNEVVNLTGADSIQGLPWSYSIACSDEATAITTGNGKVTFRMPFAVTLTAVRASVGTAPTGSTIIIDINEGGSSVLSTKLSIDASEKTSTTAASAAVISDSAIADDAEITIDFDQVGSTIAGAGVKVTLYGTRIWYP